MQLYDRQILLEEIGPSGQQKIQNAKILVIGLGGLGNPVIQYLAAAGVKYFGIVDGDVVTESNLHRQILFSITDIGHSKTSVIKDYCKKHFQSIEVNSYNTYLDKKLALEIFNEYDVIVDGTDSFSTKQLINEVCLYFNKPMVYASISQFDGQISVFWKSQSSCYKCLVPKIPKSKIQNCSQAGVISPLPGIIGTMQAMEVIKIIVGNFEELMPLFGKLSVFDFKQNYFKQLEIPKLENCLCSKVEIKIDDIGDYEDISCSIDTLKVYIDVREEGEIKQQEKNNSINWALSKIENGILPEKYRDRSLVTYCHSGSRAERAAAILKDNGYLVKFRRTQI